MKERYLASYFRKTAAQWFPAQSELRQYTVQVFRIYILPFLLLGFNISVSGYLTAVERAVPALLISAGRSFVLLTGSLIVLIARFGGRGIWWAPFASEALCFLLTAFLFLQYRRKYLVCRA